MEIRRSKTIRKPRRFLCGPADGRAWLRLRNLPVYCEWQPAGLHGELRRRQHIFQPQLMEQRLDAFASIEGGGGDGGLEDGQVKEIFDNEHRILFVIFK